MTIPSPPKVDIDFTGAQLTGIVGGWSLLAKMAQQTGVLSQLAENIKLKQRQRGASDSEMLWALIASLAAGATTTPHRLCRKPHDFVFMNVGQTPCQSPSTPLNTPYTHEPTRLNSNEICSTRILSSLPQNSGILSYPFPGWAIGLDDVVCRSIEARCYQ